MRNRGRIKDTNKRERGNAVQNKEQRLSKFLLEKETRRLVQSGLRKISDNAYMLNADGTKVKLVFDNVTNGIPLEKALAKIVMAERWR